jgi:hypothetical protein
MTVTCAACIASAAGNCSWQMSITIPPAFPACCSCDAACASSIGFETARNFDGGAGQLCPPAADSSAPASACQLSRARLPLPSPVAISCFVGSAFQGAPAEPAPSPREFTYCFARSYTCMADPSAATNCPDGAASGAVVREYFGAPFGVGVTYPLGPSVGSFFACNGTTCNAPGAPDPCAPPPKKPTTFSAVLAFVEDNKRASLAALVALALLLLVPWRLGWYTHCRVRLCGAPAPPRRKAPLLLFSQPRAPPAPEGRAPVGLPPACWRPPPGAVHAEALPPGWSRRGACGGGDEFFEDPRGRLIRCRRGTMAEAGGGGWLRVGVPDARGDQAWLSPQGRLEVCRKGSWRACPGAAALAVAAAAREAAAGEAAVAAAAAARDAAAEEAQGVAFGAREAAAWEAQGPAAGAGTGEARAVAPEGGAKAGGGA